MEKQVSWARVAGASNNSDCSLERHLHSPETGNTGCRARPPGSVRQALLGDWHELNDRQQRKLTLPSSGDQAPYPAVDSLPSLWRPWGRSPPRLSLCLGTPGTPGFMAPHSTLCLCGHSASSSSLCLQRVSFISTLVMEPGAIRTIQMIPSQDP